MRKFLSLFLVIGLAACTEGYGLGVDAGAHGSYTLEAVNGRMLPYTISEQGGVRQEIYAGTLRLERGGYFTERLEIEENDWGRITRYTDRYSGEYEETTRGGVILYYDDGGVLEGDYTSRDLRLYGSGQTIVYRRY